MSKRKRNNVIRIGNRNAVAWTQLQQAVVPEDAKKEGVIAVVQNALYTVFIKETRSHGFEAMDESGEQKPMKISHLIIIRNDRKKKEIDWDHKQRIKDEVCGQMCEAVEIFPAAWRRMDMTQTHLWVLAPGASFPLGIFPKSITDAETPTDVTVTKEELEVFVVRGEVEGKKYVEVFADEEEAKEMYDKAGNELTGGGIERIGSVPTADDGAAWTDNAKLKVANIISKAEVLDSMNAPSQGDDVELPFYDDGPSGVEEEIDSEMDFDMSLMEGKAQLIYGPPTLEENIQIAEFMERKMAQAKDQRDIRIDSAADVVKAKLDEQDDSEAEAEAAADLKAYRKKLLDGDKGEDDPGEDPTMN